MEIKKKQKDRLLRENMMKEEMTGYPSIDKPWLRYYEKSVNRRLKRE
ncbi:MAG: hypothetical protein MJ110_02965 [Lachnospiraceae bacterium]|nr:hypothetical protein [Lachnospiraceae bacterium]